jgi:hypothetical protein
MNSIEYQLRVPKDKHLLYVIENIVPSGKRQQHPEISTIASAGDPSSAKTYDE